MPSTSPSLLAVVFHREEATGHVLVEGGGALASAVLQRSGFIPDARGEQTYHRLPSSLTDLAEQRHLVGRAAATLTHIGFDVTLDLRLATNGPVPGTPWTSAASLEIFHITDRVSRAGHTREAAAALAEITDPMGVLSATLDALRETARWWHGLGDRLDELYAARMEYITDQIASYATELGALRGELADRHTTHPHRGQVQTPTAPNPSPAPRPAPSTPSSVGLRARRTA